MSENLDHLKDLKDNAGATVATLARVYVQAARDAANEIAAAMDAAEEERRFALEAATLELRMSAFAGVLETLAARKAALLEEQQTAKGARKTLAGLELASIARQEAAILVKAGAAPQIATGAVKQIEQQPADQPTHVRVGKRFVRAVEHPNGTPPAA
jgi:hypothetical protein